MGGGSPDARSVEAVAFVSTTTSNANVGICNASRNSVVVFVSPGAAAPFAKSVEVAASVNTGKRNQDHVQTAD